MELKKETICVQGGWQPGNERAACAALFTRAPHLSMRRVRRWVSCLTWRRRDISIPDFRIPPVIP